MSHTPRSPAQAVLAPAFISRAHIRPALRRVALLSTALLGACGGGWNGVAPTATVLELQAGTVNPAGRGSTDGAAAEARFSFPLAVAADALGNVWVADSGNYSLRKIDATGQVTTVAGQPGAEPAHVDGAPGTSRLRGPTGLALGPNGALHFVDGLARYNEIPTLRRLLPDGRVTTLTAAPAPSSAPDYYLSAFSTGLAVTAAGDSFIAQTAACMIWRVAASGAVSAFSHTGTTTGKNPCRLFDSIAIGPRGLAADAQGRLVYATGSSSLRRLDADATESIFGNRPAAFDALVMTPDGGAMGAVEGGHALYRLAPDGAITLWAGAANSSGSNDGPADQARFNETAGVAIDTAGNIFVADRLNHVIRKITPQGQVSTLAGLATDPLGDSADGVGGRARLASPLRLASSAQGVSYVLQANRALRRIDADGSTRTLLRDTAISDLAVDAEGRLLVLDAGIGSVRRMDVSGVWTELFVGSTSSLPTRPVLPVSLTGGSRLATGPQGAVWVLDCQPPLWGVGSVQAPQPLPYAIKRITAQGQVEVLLRSSLYFECPNTLAVDPRGRAYFAHISGVYRYAPTQAALAGTPDVGQASGPLSAGAPAEMLARISAVGLAVDAAGQVFVADAGAGNGTGKVHKIDAAGRISTVAGSSDPTARRLGALPVRLGDVAGVAVSAQGVHILAGPALLLARP